MADKVWDSRSTLYRDGFKSKEEYLIAYRQHCQHYGYRARVVGGWKFFEFENDYKTWKKQR